MRRFRPLWLLCLVWILALTACSTPVTKETPNKAQSGEQKPKEPSKNAEGMLYEGPGILAGDAYSEAKAKQELKKLSKNLSVKEAYMELLRLFAEDYRPVVKEINDFDTNPYFIASDEPGDLKSPGKSPEKKLRVVILLDASGSMAGMVDGGKKMDVAKAAVKRYASSLPQGAEVSLRVYGHKGSNQKKDKSVSCKSTEEVYPLSAYQQGKFDQSLEQFQPTGWTPIALAMNEAKKDLERHRGENTQNVMYIVSDGEETCGGDPVKVAKELNQSDIQAVVNIIGFDVNDRGQRELEAAAKAGGGEYFSARDESDLRRYLDRQKTRLWSEWFDWGAHNWHEVSLQYVRQKNKLRDLAFPKGKFGKILWREYGRMKESAIILQQQGQLESDKYNELLKVLWDRKEKLDAYRERRYEELDKELRKNRDELQDLIEKKRNEEQEQLR